MQVLVVERTQQIQIQEQEIIRKEKELEAKVKKPAEAERYRLETLAEAEKYEQSPTLFLHPFAIKAVDVFSVSALKWRSRSP